MSFTTEKPWVPYSGNGSTVEFAFNHRTYDEGDIVVLLTDASGNVTTQTITTHYTVATISSQPGEDVDLKVTMVTAPASGEKLTIYRKPDFTQPDTFSINENWQGAPLEIRLDIITQFCQYLKLQTDRSIKNPMAEDDSVTVETPLIADRASLALVYDASGNIDVGGAVAVPEATLSDINNGVASKYMPPDKFAQSIYGTKTVGLPLFDSATSVAVGDGTIGIPVTAELNGMSVIDVIAIVHVKGITGTTDIQIRRRRAGVDVDILTTKITIGDEFFARDGGIDLNNDDLQTGDMLYADVDAVHSGTAPLGLSIGISALKP